MRATITADDNMVYVDGEWASVDCSTLPDNLHAMQWYGDWGEEEFKTTVDATGMTRQPNNRITDLSPYQSYLDAWKSSYMLRKAQEKKVQNEIENAWKQAKELEAKAVEEFSARLPP